MSSDYLMVKNVYYGISMPPFEKGLQRSIRQIALNAPLNAPYFFIARIAYSEQVG